FALLPHFLEEGDLVVVNTSGTLPAAVDALAPDGTRVVLHLSTNLDGDDWVVEPRVRDGRATARWPAGAAPPPRHLVVGEGATIDLLERYLDSPRLWVARLSLPQPTRTWLAVHGQP